MSMKIIPKVIPKLGLKLYDKYSFNLSGITLPRTGLIWYSKAPGMVDTIGESSILYQSGDASTWATTAVWGFERTAAMIALDTLLGGGVLFSGSDVIYRKWSEWVDIASVNADYLFIGLYGVAAYSVDQSANADRIKRYLYTYACDIVAPPVFFGAISDETRIGKNNLSKV